MNHECGQHKAILDLNKDMAKLSERVAVIEITDKHVAADLAEIKASLAVLVLKSSQTENTIHNSKGFIGGVVATTSIIFAVATWLAGFMFSNFFPKK